MAQNWYDLIDKGNIPKHVAIIMDGNGRWAKERKKVRMEGHREGAKNLRKLCNDAMDIGITHMTVYAFSTENWNRPESEVKFLMNLLRQGLDQYRKDAIESDIRIRVIGDITRLDKELQTKIANIVELTKANKSFNLQIAINYGSRDELIRAFHKMAHDIKDSKLNIADINEEVFTTYLDTNDIPDPDLMIRTSGEQRLSNYLLWQLAYAEFYFTDVKWPAFDRNELYKAIYYYQNRDRRFGAL